MGAENAEAAEVIAIVMAAGGGTRMQAKLPKTLHLLGGKPMVTYPISALLQLRQKSGFSLADIVVVVGVKSGKVKRAILQQCKSEDADSRLSFVKQKTRLGTGDAAKQALTYIRSNINAPNTKNSDTYILILPADVPNITPETLNQLIQTHINPQNPDSQNENPSHAATILTAELDDPTGYGRIVYESGKLAKIAEQKDATPEELKIKEINTSIYCFNLEALGDALEKIQPSAVTQEYYLTDVVKIFLDAGKSVGTFSASNVEEIMGVNTPEEFKHASEARKIAENHSN